MRGALTTTTFGDTVPAEGRVHPFAAFRPLEEIRRRERAAERRFGLPRNVTVHLRLLADSLLENEPDTVIYCPPADPREYLALYETARSLFGFPRHVAFGPGTGPPAERPGESGPSADRPGAGLTPPSSRRRRWPSCQFVNSALNDILLPLAAAYEEVLAAGIGLPRHPGRGEPPPREPGPAPSPRAGGPGRLAAAPAGPRPALFGDWLLGPGLLDRLESHGARPVFIQAIFDVLRKRAKPGLLPFAARPFREKTRAYGRALRALGAGCLIFVHAPFSHNRASWGRELSRFDLPALFLECAVPGYLTEGERIRLENFLARLGA
ncbi:MAG: hypothetical protein KA419_00245 [Acidobacteria bacterium]|nr:hypothetical protein [Acidobacteriota bacterium]